MSQNAPSAASMSVTDQPSITTAVVDAVAAAESVSPLEITTPLGTVIDPDALDTLFTSTAPRQSRSGQVSFEYYGYHVTVQCDDAQLISVDLDEDPTS